MPLETAMAHLEAARSRQVIEILILSGEVHPRSARRSDWFQHVYDLCELALSQGFLPHTNVGPLSFVEMARLKTVNASMGLMLEQLTPSLLQTVHRRAPSKAPDLRLQQLHWAGQLQIPFTTGLLLGIGETEADWQDSLEAIAQVHQEWGHIQEVILQPHSPGQSQAWPGEPFQLQDLPQVVAIARQILPADITLQIPPNLVQAPETLLACLAAGARDLGGIVPKDEVNPDYAHTEFNTLKALLSQAGWQLEPRLPVYRHYEAWLSPELRDRVVQWCSKISTSNRDR